MLQVPSSEPAATPKDTYLPVTFEIRVGSLEDGEAVYISGNCPELGSWSPKKAVALNTSVAQSPKWSQQVALPAGSVIEYRYIIKRKESVQRWENLGKREHRTVHLKDCLSLVIDDGVFGEEKEKTVWIDRGWLTDGLQMNLWPHYRTPFVELLEPREWSLQLLARKPSAEPHGSFGLHKSLDIEDMYIFYSPDEAFLSFDVEVWSVADPTVKEEPYLIGKAVVLPYKFKQRQYGHIRLPLLNHALEVVGTFRCQFLIITPFVHDKNNLSRLERGSFLYGNKEELYIGHRGSGASKKYRHSDGDDDSGSSDSESDSDEEKKPPKQKMPNKVPRKSSIGKCAPSVLTTPKNGQGKPKRRKPHKSPPAPRGLAGNITENTILSFVTAAQIGADYIEFDIHLTKDSVPVIAHDMHLHIPTETIHGTPCSVQVPVNNLTEKKFRQMRRYIPQSKAHLKALQKALPDTRGKMKRSNSFGDVADLSLYELGNVEIAAPNTTLQEVLQTVPEHIGFDIEIKYPETETQKKATNYPDRNHVIDRTLKVVFDYAGNRPIFFSSFDPDVCLMLNLKQPRYPVFLLTLGGYFEKYDDSRRNGLYQALSWAKQVHLRGVAPWTKALLPDLAFVKEAHAANMLVFSWGSDNNETQPVERQKEAGVDAIISDNILRVKPVERNPVHGGK